MLIQACKLFRPANYLTLSQKLINIRPIFVLHGWTFVLPSKIIIHSGHSVSNYVPEQTCCDVHAKICECDECLLDATSEILVAGLLFYRLVVVVER
jgi:hypothetical protein